MNAGKLLETVEIRNHALHLLSVTKLPQGIVESTDTGLDRVTLAAFARSRGFLSTMLAVPDDAPYATAPLLQALLDHWATSTWLEGLAAEGYLTRAFDAYRIRGKAIKTVEEEYGRTVTEANRAALFHRLTEARRRLPPYEERIREDLLAWQAGRMLALESRATGLVMIEQFDSPLSAHGVLSHEHRDDIADSADDLALGTFIIAGYALTFQQRINWPHISEVVKVLQTLNEHFLAVPGRGLQHGQHETQESS
jgi:hypothetical protein